MRARGPGSARLAPKVLACALGFLTVVAAAVAQPDEPPQVEQLEQLAFMVGCWRGELAGGGVVEERFTPPEGGLMLGNSRTLEGGEVQFFEFSRIHRQGSGWAYTPYPAGRASVSFRLVNVTERQAVFENLEHDFPQRIVYRRADAEGGEVLVARIEDAAGQRAQEFTMDRVPCTPE